MPSDLQVTNLKANDGTAGLVIADSTGQVTGTLGSATVFPAGMVLQTVSDNYNSQTETSSQVKVCSITFTTKKANSKIAYWFTTALGGYGDGDNVHMQMTLETGTTANTPSSSNYLPTDNRGPGTEGQTNGKQLHIDSLVESANLAQYIINTYTSSDFITTSYAKDTQLTFGAFLNGGCFINRSLNRANEETGITSLIIQEIAT